MYQLAWTYDIVHGVASIGIECDHDVETSCPKEEVFAPIRVEIDADWLPEAHRLDRTLPVFSTMNSQAEMGISGYITLGYFDGLQNDPDWTIVCDGQPVVPGWGNFGKVSLPDAMLEDYGVDHEGVRDAIERGAAETTDPVTRAGGSSLLQCGALGG